MKKYFLLATTALLLGTNNVMADFDYQIDMNVYAAVEHTSTVTKLKDANFGTLYIKWQTLMDTKLASFSADGYTTTPDVAHAEGEQTGEFYVTYGDTEQEPVIKNLPNGILNLGSGLEVRNVGLLKTNTSSDGMEANYQLIGDLYTTEDSTSGSGNGVLTIGFDY